jgi:hypothetical protein
MVFCCFASLSDVKLKSKAGFELLAAFQDKAGYSSLMAWRWGSV